ncbi:uncharacterized protein LOC132745009 [Ruditapes philippinarum]|uniref:uncharacterized protein LOC132745009 n=1 Tax=Ruditapes philippinarum TaxID=129788 RepID=UPI00295BF60F|nr:uncharacterized protein LOC132745009 [Ruditapes philippinarum]
MKFDEDNGGDTSLTTLPVTIYIGLIAILGIIGNIVVLVVYNRKYPKCNFKYFVLVLAGLDLTSCTILMPMEIYTLINWFQFTYPWLCKIKSFLNVFTVTSSAATLLLIAIDRFRKVCKPHSKQIQPELAIKLSILVLFLSVIPATSDAIFWGIHTHEEANITAHMCEKDNDFKHTIWPQLHVAILYAGVNSIVMMSTFVLYVLIAVKLFCIPSGPAVTTPKITLQSDHSSGVEPSDTENNVFKLSADIESGLSESGLSESEDFDCVPTVDQSDSADVKLDDTKDDVKGKINEDKMEMVTLRPKSVELKCSVPGKAVRLSLQRHSDSCDRNSLQIPDIKFRKIPKVPVSPTTEQFKKQAAYRRRRSTIGSLSKHTGTRLRRKTLIMFILTAVFIVTTVLYFCLIGLMADHESLFVKKLTMSEQTAWFFFLRLYFINSVINPVLYGFLDPRFRRALWNMGIRITFAAGSLKRNIGMSIRSRSSTGRNEVTVVQTSRVPRPILKSGSSMTVSE